MMTSQQSIVEAATTPERTLDNISSRQDETAIQIRQVSNTDSYQQYSPHANRPLRSVVNTNYPEIGEITTETSQAETGESEQTRFIDHLYRFYWRSTQDVFNHLSRFGESAADTDSSSIFSWLWTTWTFFATWLTLIQCRFFSPWTSSLGGSANDPPGFLHTATEQSRDEIFVQDLVHAIESNDQVGFVRMLNDSVDTGRHQTCLNSPIAYTYRGKPVLHYAVRFQRVEMLEILLSHCAEYCLVEKSSAKTAGEEAPAVHAYYASLVDDGGNTALHEMAHYSAYVDEHMMRLLLAHGCQPTSRNMRGYTCAQEALQQNNIKFCLLLCDVWPQAKHKLIQEVIATAMQVGGNNKRAVSAVLQLLNGLLLVEQLDAAAIDALLLNRKSADDAEEDDVGSNVLMKLDIDLNRVDAEKPVNILHEALRTGLIVANNQNIRNFSDNRKKLKGFSPGNVVDDTAEQQQQRLLRLLISNARVDTTVCDENFIKTQQRLAWHNNDQEDLLDSCISTGNDANTASGNFDDIDAYFNAAGPDLNAGYRSRTSSSGSSHSSSSRQRLQRSGSAANLEHSLSVSSQSDLAAYFQPPAHQQSAHGQAGAEAWAWLHSMCSKLDPLASVAQNRIEFEPKKLRKGASKQREEEKFSTSEKNDTEDEDQRPKTINCSIHLHSHHLVSSVMLTPGPLTGPYKAQLFSLPSPTSVTADSPSKSLSTKPKKSSKDAGKELLGEFPTISFPGNAESSSYRIKYRLNVPVKVKHLLLVLTPSTFSAQPLHQNSLKSFIHRHKNGASGATTSLPSDFAVFGIEETLNRLMSEQLQLGRSQITELLRNGINTSDTLIHIPRFRLRHLMSRSGCRLPTITRMLDYVDTLASGEACPVEKIEWLVQPPRVGWEMRDIGTQIVVLTVDEDNKWSHITRSVEVELSISSERGGPPIRRITRVDIPRRAILLEKPHKITSPASKTEATTKPPARRVIAEFSDIRLPYGNYKLMARLKRKPKLTAQNPEHALEIKVAYYGGGDESIMMPPYVGVGGSSAMHKTRQAASYFERQHSQQNKSSNLSSKTASDSKDSSWLGLMTSWLPGLDGTDADGTDSEIYATRARARTMDINGFQQSGEYAMMGTTTA